MRALVARVRAKEGAEVEELKFSLWRQQKSDLFFWDLWSRALLLLLQARAFVYVSDLYFLHWKRVLHTIQAAHQRIRTQQD